MINAEIVTFSTKVSEQQEIMESPNEVVCEANHSLTFALNIKALNFLIVTLRKQKKGYSLIVTDTDHAIVYRKKIQPQELT